MAQTILHTTMHHEFVTMRRLVGCFLLVFLAGCDSAKTLGESNSPSRMETHSPTIETKFSGPENCNESTRYPPDDALRGRTNHGELWGLTWGPSPNGQLKLVVRVTGSGELTSYAVKEGGGRISPFDITQHTGSNFARPGDEWGLWYEFERAGCWKIFIERGNVRGRFILDILS